MSTCKHHWIGFETITVKQIRITPRGECGRFEFVLVSDDGEEWDRYPNSEEANESAMRLANGVCSECGIAWKELELK